MLNSLKKSFVTGLVLTLPLGITLFFVDIMLRYVGDPASKVLFCWLNAGGAGSKMMDSLIDVVSLVLVVFIIIAIGFFSKLFFGKILISWTEKVINHVPFINAVYKTVKQVIETFGHGNSEAFSKVVLIEYPKEGCYAIGFVSSTVGGEVQDKTNEDVVNVFVPTTPNPTSGFLLMVPRRSVTELEMSVADGMKLIISGGIVIPPYKKQRKDENARNG
jgi:uncharacterized membrane protein